MGDASNNYKEISSEDDEVATAPTVVHNEPLGVIIPAPGAESPESSAASPLPAASEASGQGRVGIKIPLDENMVAPPSPAPAVGYNSDDEAFGAEHLQKYSSRSSFWLEMWKDATRQYKGRAVFVYTIPSISTRFATFLQSLYGDHEGRNICCQRPGRLLFLS